LTTAFIFFGQPKIPESTYDDGEVLGSLIGRINLKTMKIDLPKKSVAP
jgi:hypothetical protein